MPVSAEQWRSATGTNNMRRPRQVSGSGKFSFRKSGPDGVFFAHILPVGKVPPTGKSDRFDFSAIINFMIFALAIYEIMWSSEFPVEQGGIDNYLRCQMSIVACEMIAQLVSPFILKLILMLSGDVETNPGPEVVLTVNEHLRHVRAAVLNVAYKWKDFGLALGINPDTLETIRGKDQDCLYDILKVWIQSGQATIDQVLSALEDPSVNRIDIANEIRARKGDDRNKVGLAPDENDSIPSCGSSQLPLTEREAPTPGSTQLPQTEPKVSTAEKMKHLSLNHILADYADLSSQIVDFLFEQQIDLKSLQLYLSLHKINDNWPSSPQDIRDIFLYLSKEKLLTYDSTLQWSSLVKKYCQHNSAIVSNLEDYKTKFTAFKATQNLAKFIELTNAEPLPSKSVRDDPEIYSKISATVEVNVDEKTLTYIYELWKEIVSELFGVPPLNVLLGRVLSGSLCIDWFVPAEYFDELVANAKSVKAQNAFQLHQIVQLCVNDKVIYQFEQTPLHLAARNDQTDILNELLEAGSNLESKNKNGDTPLILACLEGHLRIVKQLLNAGAVVDSKRTNGDTPLHVAAKNDRPDILNVVLETGPNLEAINGDGYTPLHLAAGNDRPDILNMLLESGCNLEAKDGEGDTLLIIACFEGHLIIVQQLLKAGATIDSKRTDGFTPLIIAAQEGHEDVVNVLVAAGANLETKTNNGTTPLCISSQNGHTPIVNLLIQKGADVNVKREDGFSPLLIAAQERHEDVVNVLIAAGANLETKTNDGTTPLYISSHNGHTPIVNLLIQRGADVNVKREGGFTPLLTAADEGHEDVVNVLVAAGANLEIKTNDGSTPLYVSSQNGHTPIVNLLIQRGADVNVKEENGGTPLYISSQNGHTSIVNLLIQRGADVNVKNEDGATPLQVSSQNGHTPIVNLLIQRGADVNVKAEHGYSPLHGASYKGHLDIVQMLLKRSADPNAVDEEGLTPMMFAIEGQHPKVVSALLKHKADVNILDTTTGWPALFHAASAGALSIVEMLLEYGADVDIKDKNNATASDVALLNNHQEVSEIIQKQSKLKKTEQLSGEVKEQTKSKMEYLKKLFKVLEDRLLPEKSKKRAFTSNKEDGTTPLYISSRNGHTPIVNLLIQRGADVNVKSVICATPLFISSMKGHTPIVNLLIQRGANVNVKAKNGYSPLHGASFMGHLDIVQILFKRSADPNAVDENGLTPMMFAIQGQHPKVVSALLKHKADVNILDTVTGWPALFHAASTGASSIVETLLEYGADVDIKDKNNATALDIALLNNHQEVSEIIQKQSKLKKTEQLSREVKEQTKSKMEHLKKLFKFLEDGLLPEKSKKREFISNKEAIVSVPESILYSY